MRHVNTYAVLKLLHILAVIAWLGGSLNMTLLTWRITRAGDGAALATLQRHAAFVGPALIGPASVLTLVTGIGMVVAGGVDPGALWVQWGMAGIVIHFLFGPLFLRRAGIRLGQATAAGDSTRIADARRRLGQLSAIYLVLLLSVVSAMVLKPTI
jgi:uncharacterized membrane protein